MGRKRSKKRSHASHREKRRRRYSTESEESSDDSSHNNHRSNRRSNSKRRETRKKTSYTPERSRSAVEQDKENKSGSASQVPVQGAATSRENEISLTTTCERGDLLEHGTTTEAAAESFKSSCAQQVLPLGQNSEISVNTNDLTQILKSLVRPPNINSNTNMIPEFDPSIKSHRIDLWISKVNECANIYKWDEMQIMHFALPKLVGNAKKWYQGQTSIMHNWEEWQVLLKKAFPSETNYGVLLTEMLERRLKFGENIDEYYYDKVTLLSACSIIGKRAVDCIIHGIDDRTIRAGASSARFTESEDLFKYLKDVCKEQKDISRTSVLNKRPISNIRCNRCNEIGHKSFQCSTNSVNSFQKPMIVCFNCNEKGHRISQCPKPIIKCDNCKKFGHNSSNCMHRKESNLDKKVLFVESYIKPSNEKYYKEALINNNCSTKCFIDLGSDCTLISQAVASKLGLIITTDNVPSIQGVANVTIPLLGKTTFHLKIDLVEAEITAYVIEDNQIHIPLLVGQNFTEMPEVIITKTDNSLNLFSVRNTGLTEIDIDVVTNEKYKLYVACDSTISNIGLLDCYCNDFSNTDIYVEGSYRCMENKEYCIQEGIYKIKDGKCKILVINIGKLSQPLYLPKDFMVVRAYPACLDVTPVKSTSHENMNCFKTQLKEPIKAEEININQNLTYEQKEQVFNLINKYRNCFALDLSELGCTDLTELDIKLTDDVPIMYRPYRMSYGEKEILRDMVKELQDNDIIEESESSYASPVILVSKKTGGYRLCVDYRALNRKTVKDLYPLPRIDDQLDLLSGNTFFISLDMSSGYYQIPIKDSCKHLTAFITPDGLYHFKRAPFGLANCPAVFQRTVNKMLGKLRDKCAIAYMDDLLISGTTFDECLFKLEQTFALILDAGLTLNVKKCRFFETKIDYLGFEISAEGIRPGCNKIDAVRCFPQPKSVHEVRQFVGLASFFRKFIQHFAHIARPLTDLTRQNRTWEWRQQQQESFQNLKEKLVQRPILALYNPQYLTELHCDASKSGLGGILLQKESVSSKLQPVAFFSRKTTIDEEKLHAYELETLAVVTSLNRFRVYLLGKHFTIVTDCSALRSTFTKRDLIPRIARWWIALQEYDCSIEYRPGNTMQHVDALSRNALPCENDNDKFEHFSRVMQITENDWLLSIQLTDPKIQHIRSALEDPKYKELVDIKQNFVLKNNRLYRKVGADLKWVVPKGARWQICQRNHDEIGHFSIEKTLEKIKRDFWFPKMKKFVSKYVKACLHCAFDKEPAGPKEGYLHSIPKTDIPFHTVHADHLGPFVKSNHGNQYLLLVVDGFTKFCIIKPLRSTKTQPTIRALKEIFYTFGHPMRLITDRGSCFTSGEFLKFCADVEIQHVLNAVSAPRANGQVERYNRTVLDSLRTYTDRLGERQWDHELGKIQWGLNNTLNKGIGRTPAEVLFCRRPLNRGEGILGEAIEESRRNDEHTVAIRSEISKHIESDQAKQRLRFDKSRKAAKVYCEGDLVKILKTTPSNDGKSRKLLPKYTGPFRITKVLGNDRYEVSSIPGSHISRQKYKNVWAADRMQPWITMQQSNSSSSDSDEISSCEKDDESIIT